MSGKENFRIGELLAPLVCSIYGTSSPITTQQYSAVGKADIIGGWGDIIGELLAPLVCITNDSKGTNNSKG